MSILQDNTRAFRKELEALSREDLLEILLAQDPDIVKQINRIEWVFKNRLNHLTWPDGRPIEGRPFTKQELALLVDQPFRPIQQLSDLGVSIQDQQKMHVAADPVLWARSYLNANPRVYQTLLLRWPSKFKVLRLGRRAGKTHAMAILLLHYAYTTSKGRSLVLTPMKPQAGLIYKEIMELVEDTVVFNSMERYVTAPQYEIEFSNGSSIRFFTSGMKSGGKSNVTRGQEAHLIVLDEMDYMGDDDLEAIYAMLQKTKENQPDKVMIGASTPSGKRSTFYEWCVSPKSRFKEFWFPSYANPLWDKEMEEFFRDFYNINGYRREIEADFGENAEGVYPKKFVDKAFNSGVLRNPKADMEKARRLSTWKYEPEPEQPDSTYIIGVDWDKYAAGVNIVILELMSKNHPDKFFRNKMRVCYREEITQEEYLLTYSTQRVIELSNIFNPAHIYVDRGFGETQYEILKKYGVDNPQSGLTQSLKGISFASSIEVKDPYTMQPVKEPIKPFMVDSLRTMLEKEQIFFSAHDEELYMQLTSYIVVRVNESGRPIFEAPSNIGDHAHDALILACLAVTENYSALMKTNYAYKPIVISNHKFSSLIEVAGSANEVQRKKEMIEDKYGSTQSAPVMYTRPMSYNIRGKTNRYERKKF